MTSIGKILLLEEFLGGAARDKPSLGYGPVCARLSGMRVNLAHYVEYALICFFVGYGMAWSIEYIGPGERAPLPIRPLGFGLIGLGLGLVWARWDLFRAQKTQPPGESKPPG